MTRLIPIPVVLLMLSVVLASATARAVEPSAAPATPLDRRQSVQFVEFEDITPAEGLLRERAARTMALYKAYSPEHVLTLNYSTTPSDKAFPGDTIE